MLLLEIAFELGQQRAGLFLSDQFSVPGGLTVDLSLNGVKFSDLAQRLLGDRRFGTFEFI